jgi:hypothetical protein
MQKKPLIRFNTRGGGTVRGRGEGREMAQTLYAHMNKRNNKKRFNTTS